MKLTNFLWLIPFGCFALGYIAAHIFFRTETLKTPNTVGLPLAIAVENLSKHGIGVRICAHKPSTDVPEGTVLIQSPGAGQSIKTHQTVLLVIAEQPPLPKTPSFLGLSRDAAEKEATQQRISVLFVPIKHPAATNICCAQSPTPGQPLSQPSMIVYYAEKTTSMVIWPSCSGKSVEEVLPWLEALNIRFEITTNSSCYDNKKKLLEASIIDQHPRAGTIMPNEPDKHPTVLLHLP